MNKISVIIPVYNTEAYLDKCIESVVNQTYLNTEIILVDDGSSDGSGIICDSWAEKDERIIVIHQKNCGGAAARNRALEVCSGDFISFIDSDDYISPFFLQFLFSMFDELIDIVECGFLSINRDDVLFGVPDVFEGIVECDSIHALRENICDTMFRQIIWNKLYRKSVINNIRFVEGKQIDDEFWTYKVIGNARKLIHVDNKLYAYRQQEQSVMHVINPTVKVQAFEAQSIKHEYICEKYPTLKEQSAVKLWFSGMYYAQLVLRNCDGETKQKCMEFIFSTLKKYPVLNKKSEKFVHRLWLLMAEKNLVITCGIRNFFRIGV